MAKVIGDTHKTGKGRRRSKFIRVARADYDRGVYLKKFTGLRHADKEDGYFEIPREQLSHVINLLLDAEKTLRGK